MCSITGSEANEAQICEWEFASGLFDFSNRRTRRRGRILSCAESCHGSAAAPVQEIQISIDEDGKRVIFEGWGEIPGAGAELLIALAAPFHEARQRELAPEQYPYLKTQKLKLQLDCGSDEVLRRRVRRCRNAIKKLAEEADNPELPMDAVVESSQWHGYRLNPDRVRLIAYKTLINGLLIWRVLRDSGAFAISLIPPRGRCVDGGCTFSGAATSHAFRRKVTLRQGAY